MPEHFSAADIDRYRRRELSDSELAELLDHVAVCQNCRDRMTSPDERRASAEAFVAAVNEAAPQLRHLTYAQKKGLADEALSAAELEIAARHVRTCRRCAAEVKDLERLKGTLEQAGPNYLRRGAGAWRPAIFGWKGAVALTGVAACVLAILYLKGRPAAKPAPAEIVHREPARPSGPQNRGSSQVPAEAAVRDGGRSFTFGADGRVSGLDEVPVEYRAAVERALTVGAFDPPEGIADLRGPKGSLLGSADQPSRVKLLDPAGIVVETTRPTFRWQSSERAAFQLSLFDESYREAARSEWIEAQEWTVTTPLKRGMRYSWQLLVRTDNGEFMVPAPPAPEARFRVLSAERELEVERLRTRSQDSHLLLATAYFRFGLLPQARQELRILRSANPRSAVVEQLLSAAASLSAKPE